MSAVSVDFRQRGEPYVTLGKVPCLLLAIAYGGLLVSLPLLGLQDRSNYLNYAGDSLIILARNLAAGPLVTLSNSPLWLLLNGSLRLVLQPEQIMRLIIFAQSATVAYVLQRADRKNWLWIIALLFMPSFLENFTVHLRQGCGITVFLLGWFSTGRVKRWVLICASPFVHESFAFVVALLVMTEMMRRLRLAHDVRIAVTIAFSLLVGLGLVALATFVGARQVAEYNLMKTGVSGAAFLVWSVLLLLMLLERRDLGRGYEFAIAAVVFYLGTYFLIDVSGRIFESMIPLVFLCGLRLTRWRRIMFLWLTVSFAALGWAMALTNAAGSFF